MSTPLLNERDLEFLLYEFLDTEQLTERPRYCDHSKEVFDSILDTARTVAERYFAPHNAKGDAQEARFVNGEIDIIPETRAAWKAFADAGFLAAHYDEQDGGYQLPEIILRAAMAYFNAANISDTGYPFLSIGAGNLIHTFGSEEQKSRYLPAMREGRFSGTMALTEPDQGSALGDLKTVARAAGDGSYRLFGKKMFTSCGDHPLTENIVHLVLARIEGAPSGVKGISLFICPKYLVNDDGSLGERNDVVLAGLLHKMGYRNTTTTVLNFGEQDGAIAYLVGEPNNGLKYMFRMMNEARIGVGLGAASLAYQGFNASLDYARQRPQGRLPSSKDPDSPQVPIIQHADVRRMLLAQKAYAEGSLALCFYACSLHEDSQTAAAAEDRQLALEALDLLTPIVKSWPGRYGLLANELAIQVLGGSGYTRDYPVEQYYRDNRLNPIHEGTEAIHGLDLLGRKVAQNQGRAFSWFLDRIDACVSEVESIPAISDMAALLANAAEQLKDVTGPLLDRMALDPDIALANATVYLDVFGRVTAAWIWLQQAVVAARALNEALPESEQHFYQGKIQAARYYLYWELAENSSKIELLNRVDDIPYRMQDAWFQVD